MDFTSLNKNIEYIKWEDGIKVIPDYAFASFYNLEEVEIPDTVENIGKGAFQNCTNLKKVKLPNNIKELPNNLFLRCSKLENIELPESLLKIGDQCFFATNLKNIVIPKNVYLIGNSAFTGVAEFTIRDGFDYTVNKYNLFTWLSEPIYDRETDGKIPDTYSFIKNVVITILDDVTNDVKFKFFIPFKDKFDIFSISHVIFRNNRLDLGLLDSQFQMIRDFENKTNYVYYRIKYPYKLTNDNKDLFTRFIETNNLKIAEKYIDDNIVEPLVELDSLNIITEKNIDDLIEYANINRKFNSLSYLMNYKNKNFSNRYSVF